jgi:hypothetical protein
MAGNKPETHLLQYGIGNGAEKKPRRPWSPRPCHACYWKISLNFFLMPPVCFSMNA